MATDESSRFYRLSVFVVNAKFAQPWIFSTGGDRIRLALRFFRLLLLSPGQFRPDRPQRDGPQSVLLALLQWFPLGYEGVIAIAGLA
jgi:hypothetical protein